MFYGKIKRSEENIMDGILGFVILLRISINICFDHHQLMNVADDKFQVYAVTRGLQGSCFPSGYL